MIVMMHERRAAGRRRINSLPWERVGLSEVRSLLMTSVCYREFMTKLSTCRIVFVPWWRCGEIRVSGTMFLE